MTDGASSGLVNSTFSLQIGLNRSDLFTAEGFISNRVNQRITKVNTVTADPFEYTKIALEYLSFPGTHTVDLTNSKDLSGNTINLSSVKGLIAYAILPQNPTGNCSIKAANSNGFQGLRFDTNTYLINSFNNMLVLVGQSTPVTPTSKSLTISRDSGNATNFVLLVWGD